MIIIIIIINVHFIVYSLIPICGLL